MRGLQIRLCAALCALPLLLQAVPLRVPPWELRCIQSLPELHCSYRAIHATAPAAPRIHAVLGGAALLPLALQDSGPYPADAERSSIYFLVDTSDPRRADVVARNRLQIRALLEQALPHQDFGLAAFDKTLTELAPLGTDRAALAQRTTVLQARGKVTELYRNAITAIAALATRPPGRRALVLFSDGLAEDTAYTLQDVIQAAQAADVVVIGLGYARTSAQVVALQSLRRLAEETGGYFVEADRDFALPEWFMGEPFARLERGGHFSLNLEQAIRQGASGDVPLQLRLQPAEFQLTVALPAPPPPAPPVSAVPPPPPASPAASREASWVSWAPWLLIMLLLMALLPLQRRRDPPLQPPSESKPLAWLRLRSEEKSRSYPITGSPWRIGRAANNDLVLEGDSVSRRHAELVYSGAGSFQLIDLGATNGVFVNDHKIDREATLHDGDRMDIGEHTLLFSLDEPGATAEAAEQTVMVSTRVPPVARG